jgi:hypothetical protein
MEDAENDLQEQKVKRWGQKQITENTGHLSLRLKFFFVRLRNK